MSNASINADNIKNYSLNPPNSNSNTSSPKLAPKTHSRSFCAYSVLSTSQATAVKKFKFNRFITDIQEVIKYCFDGLRGTPSV